MPEWSSDKTEGPWAADLGSPLSAVSRHSVAYRLLTCAARFGGAALADDALVAEIFAASPAPRGIVGGHSRLKPIKAKHISSVVCGPQRIALGG